MDEEMARRLLSMTTTSSVLQHVTLSQTTREKLVRTTYNRAVLVNELQEFVLRNVLDIPEDEIGVISSSLRNVIIQLCKNETSTVGRHIPTVVRRPLSQDGEVAYQSLRCSHWTSLDMATSGANAQARHVIQVLEEMYN